MTSGCERRAGERHEVSPGCSLSAPPQIANSLRSIINGGPSNLLKSVSYVEFVRRRIGRLEIDFANDIGVAKRRRARKEIGVQHRTVAVTPAALGDDYAVNVHELVEATAKPAKVAAVVIVRMFECEQKSRLWPDEGGNKRGRDHFI